MRGFAATAGLRSGRKACLRREGGFVWCDDRRDPRQHPTTQTRAEGRQTSPVIVSQPQALMAQLRFQDAVLFAQVLDDLVLFVLEPAEAGRDEELQRNHSAESTPTVGRDFRTLRPAAVDRSVETRAAGSTGGEGSPLGRCNASIWSRNYHPRPSRSRVDKCCYSQESQQSFKASR
jgi:hypothetical protein